MATIWDKEFTGPKRNWSKKAREYYTELRPGYRSGKGLLDKLDIDNPTAQDLSSNFHALQGAVKDQLGYEIQLMDTARTAEKQHEHFRKGRTLNPKTGKYEITNKDKVVTYKTGLLGDESKHQGYKAIDINFFPYTKQGNDPRFKEVWDIAKKMGARRWGGDWGDPAHIEW